MRVRVKGGEKRLSEKTNHDKFFFVFAHGVKACSLIKAKCRIVFLRGERKCTESVFLYTRRHGAEACGTDALSLMLFEHGHGKFRCVVVKISVAVHEAYPCGADDAAVDLGTKADIAGRPKCSQ